MTVQILQTLFILILVGNMIAYAGVDPISRLMTAAISLVFAIQLRRLPDLPPAHRAAIWGFGILMAIQLVPLPHFVRATLQPGFAGVLDPGWGSLSLAPWATVQIGASFVVATLIAFQAARMAQTRSGLPLLLMAIASTGVVAAVLGLVAEGSDPSKVLFGRENIFGGSVYGSFVNRNHFALAMELTIPAAITLLAVAIRRLPTQGLSRQKAVVSALASTVAIAVCLAALIRSSSRGGVLFMTLALIITIPWWRRLKQGRRRQWPAFVVGALLLVVISSLSWTRFPDFQERVADLVAVEGLKGNTRIDLWRGTMASWKRSPVVGSGLGTYRYVIGMDKPASGAAILEQAHNDWLEWAATGGIAAVAILGLFVFGLSQILAPAKVRNLRFEHRYALAGATLALAATMMHETIGFGLQTPVNRYLLAAWIGMAVALFARSTQRQRGNTEKSQ